MTKVFVHGNPETDAIWEPLFAELTRLGIDDIVALSPPGFGSPTPDAWGATPEDYVAWLADAVGGIDNPVDIIGHDWGAGHVFGLLARHAGLVRSWAADCAGLLHPDYVWHEAAQGWQTPDVGEEMIAAMSAVSVEDRTAAFLDLGMTESIAPRVAAACDDEMGRCILALYRGAKQPKLAQLGQALANLPLPPGLILDATDDPYVGSHLVDTVAAQLRAERAVLAGQGHWWMMSDPATAATALVAFWADLDN